MTALDTNILIAVHRADHPLHTSARQAVARLISSHTPLAIPWPCAHEFFAIVTHPKIWKDPTPPATAWRAILRWSESRAIFLSEPPEHHAILARLIQQASVAGPAIHDARIAAICIGHGVRRLLTFDRDFSRYPEINCLHPPPPRTSHR